jgi:hypothetical protein
MKPSDPLISNTLAPLFINAHAVFMAAPSDSHFTGIGVSVRKIEYDTRIVQQWDRSGSSRCAMIVAEHSSESLAPDEWVVKFANGGDGLQQPVAESLMITLAVMMAEVL